VQAEAVVVGNGVSGKILHGDDAAERRAVASITKVMTALVVLDRARPDDVVTVGGPAPRIGESSIGLRAGEKLTVRELLTALLVQSANDAAYALAWHVADGSIGRFVALMNRKAKRLGLRDTHFSRPDGLDAPGNYSSARDVFRLGRLAMHRPLFRELVQIRKTTVAGRPLTTTNDLLFVYRGTIGVKTGHTSDAGWSEVAAARRNGLTIYAVILGGVSRAQRNADLERLLDWGFDQYRRVAVIRGGEEYAAALVPFGDRRLPLVAESSALETVQVEQPLVEQVVAPAMVTLPVERGEHLGEVRVLAGDKLIATRPLVAAQSIGEPSFGERFRWYAGRALDHAGNIFGTLVGVIS
jgi:D-alanyl-D-alanine carboxypeptidase (penicillin-binding protein 5/6)